MKRSEVVQQIVDILEEDTDPRYVDSDYYIIANTIVNQLERNQILKQWDVE